MRAAWGPVLQAQGPEPGCGLGGGGGGDSFPAGSRVQAEWSYLGWMPSEHCAGHRSQDPQGKVPPGRAFPGSRCHLLPARLGEDDYGPTAALEGGPHGGGFGGVAGNG